MTSSRPEGRGRGAGPEAPSGVGELVRSVRLRLVRTGGLAVLSWWAALTCAVLVLAWFLAGPTGWEQGARAPLVLLTVLILGAGAGAIAFLRARTGVMGEDSVVRRLEESRGLPSGLLRGSLELTREGADSQGVRKRPPPSPSLVREAERAVLARAGAAELPVGPLELGLRRAARWGGGIFSAAAVLVLVLLVASPDRAFRAWSGLGGSIQLLAASPFPPLQVEPGSVDVPRGDGLDVRVTAGPRQQVHLHLHRAGDVPVTDTIQVSQGVAEGVIGEVRGPLEYWVSAPDGDRTERFSVTPLDPVFLSDLRVEVTFPPHTDLAPEEHRGEIPPLAVPEGSRLRIEGTASRDLASAALRTPGEEGGVELEVSQRSLRGEWVPETSGRYSWALTDDEGGGLAPEGLPGLDLTLVPDSVPEVELLYPARDTIVPLSRRQPLMVEARDDFGLERLEVVAYVEGREGDDDDVRTSGLELEGTRSATLRSVLDLTDWDLIRGDVVRYFARAVDNHPSAQESRTREFLLRVPGTAELGSEASRRLQEASERVEDLAGQARDLEEENRNLSRQTREVRESSGQATPGRGRPPQEGADEDGLDFGTRQDLQRSLDRHEGMVDEVDELRRELEALSQELRESGLADPDLQRDLRELQELMGDLASPELRERLGELGHALEDGDLEGVREALQELMEDQSRVREGLEESLDRFRRAAVEQELRATEEEVRDLAREERLLAQNFEEGVDPQEGARRQEALGERTEALEERFEALAERMEALGDEQAAEAARGSAEDASEVRSSMAEAGAAAEAGDLEAAAVGAGEAADGLEQLLEELQDFQEEFAEEFRQELQRALSRLAHDALGLARGQAALREDLPPGGTGDRDDLRAREAAVLQGVRNLAADLAFSTRMAPEVSRRMGPAIGEAMDAVEAAVEAMGPRRLAGPSPQEATARTHEALNRVAFEALQRAEEMAADGPSGAMESLLEELESLAQEQGQLQQEGQSLLPMDMTPEALMEALQELAQGQGDIAGGLDELAQRPGGERDDVLGDLDEFAQEARDLAQELEAGRLDAETLERQERLFQRLLDAGRTLERDEPGEDREGTTAEEVERPEVEALPPELLDGMRFRLPSAQELEALTPAQRRLVLQYFERLNRTPAGGGSPSGGDGPPGGGG